MKKWKDYLWRGILGALVLSLLVTLLLPGLGLRQRDPDPLAPQKVSPIRPEGQGAQPLEQKATEPTEAQTEPTVPEETEPDGSDQDQPESETTPQAPPEEPGGETGSAGQEPTQPGGGGDSDSTGSAQKPVEGPTDDSRPAIITDLRSCEITYDELNADVLHFYAYILNGGSQTLKIKLRNSATPSNGSYLTGEGRNYQAVLCRNETNYFTIYRKNGNVTLQEVNYAVRYVARKADSEHPTVGEHPPVIVTNLDNVTQTGNRNFTFTVSATDYKGSALYESNLEVRMDGTRVTQPTGGPVYEYQLYFPDPIRGDAENHTITVRAWDNEGNSSFVSYEITYLFTDTGDVIGTAYVVLDATTMGLGILEEPYTYRIRQNVPASYAVTEALTQWGYEYSASGTLDTGFYLQRIMRSGIMDYPDIPENLWQKILDDGLSLTGQHSNDSLGEFDYTQGSGWMYSVNGQVYAGKGLSAYYLTNGDTLYLRFTLAYGKDIGGYAATAGSFGILPTYCGRWINGTYIDEHRWSEPLQTLAPDCTHPGLISTTCQVCGQTKDNQEIPALGHDFVQTERQEPADGQDGWIRYTCTRCQAQTEDVIPGTTAPDSTEATEHEHSFEEIERQEPADGQDGWIRYACTRCGEKKEEPIPWKEDSDSPDG